MPDAFPLLLIVAFFLVMWLLLIRPQQRRQRELGAMQRSLEVGDEVMLTSGVYGVLQDLDDDVVGVRIADGVVIRVARPAIGRIVTPVDRPDPDSTDPAPPSGDPSTAPTRDDDVSEEN